MPTDGIDAATDAVQILFREGLHRRRAARLPAVDELAPHLTPARGAAHDRWLVSNANRKFRRLSKNIQTSMGEVALSLRGPSRGYRVVRSFGGRPTSPRFPQASADNTRRQLKMVRAGDLLGADALIVYSSMGLLLFTVLKVRRRLGRRRGRHITARRPAAARDPAAGRRRAHPARCGRGRQHLRAARRGA